MKWVAFHNGNLVPEDILSRIMDQALRGEMTEAAKDLLLIPDTRRGRPDTSGLREMGRVKRKDCLTLAQFARRFKKKPTKSQKSKKLEA
jgi:hypothetical protein